MKFRKEDFLFFICAAALILLVYGDIFKTFFQQDEWSWLGRHLYWNSQIPFLKSFLMGFFPQANHHFAPLASLTHAAMVYFFGLNFNFYAGFNLLGHFANAVLVYFLAKILTKRWDISLLGGLFFAFSATAYENITWFSSAILMQGATLFSLLSLIFFVKYLEQKKSKFLFLTVLTIYAALGFKVSAAFLFIFLPLYWLFWKNRKIEGQDRKDILLFFLSASFYPLIVLLSTLVGTKIETPDILQYYSLLPLNILPIVFLYQVITLPLKVIAQIYFFPKQIYLLSRKLIELSHPELISRNLGYDPQLLVETVGAEITIYILTLIFLLAILALYFFIRKNREERWQKTFIFSLFLIFTGISPLLLLLLRGQHGLVSLIRPRDLYLSLIGGAILLSTSVFFVTEKIFTNSRKIFSVILISFIFSLLFFYHRNMVDGVLSIQIERANQRRKVLDQIVGFYPNVPSKFIVYTKSDTPYYGHAEPSLPFQSGVGRSIMLWYAFYQRNLPLKFFESDFLYPFNAEGYKEINGRGFGYFYDFEKLLKTLEEYHLSSGSVYAFSWKGKEAKLEDITSEIRQKLKANLTL